MRNLPTAACTLLLVALTTSPATAQVLEGPDGPVEFIGLEHWGAQDLFDAIQELHPGRPFSACAAVMRFELGFADAGAFLYRNVGSRDSYTVVVGVEDSARVRYRPVGSETVALPEPWETLKAMGDENIRTLTAAARTLYARGGFLNRIFNSPRRLARRMGTDRETVDQALDLVGRADGEEDRRLAHDVLARDSSMAARAVATLVLGNFIDDDTSWHGLVGSAIDPHAQVASTALGMLRGLSMQDLDPVGWSAGRSHLAAVFEGTNPFAFADVLQVLVATDVDPEFGRQLVRENPNLLLAHVGAEHERTREPSVAFLQAVSGEGLGADVEAWTAWVDGLRD
ncbi:MAG: hypothetical protein OXI83_18040 [Gemmatimonadota bacterium]|nr:hypothetical protein [Gemmatimonadota bacterium]